mmetsp:Transcript_28147/g.69455  ORF Transcript_28147/g.69455 Transcript_28147/m.69455 type:complete len:298 (-) Transcript_28147:582-1475(-)
MRSRRRGGWRGVPAAGNQFATDGLRSGSAGRRWRRRRLAGETCVQRSHEIAHGFSFRRNRNIFWGWMWHSRRGWCWLRNVIGRRVSRLLEQRLLLPLQQRMAPLVLEHGPPEVGIVVRRADLRPPFGPDALPAERRQGVGERHVRRRVRLDVRRIVRHEHAQAEQVRGPHGAMLDRTRRVVPESVHAGRVHVGDELVGRRLVRAARHNLQSPPEALQELVEALGLLDLRQRRPWAARHAGVDGPKAVELELAQLGLGDRDEELVRVDLAPVLVQQRMAAPLEGELHHRVGVVLLHVA